MTPIARAPAEDRAAATPPTEKLSMGRQVMAVNDDLPIRTDKPVHSGKVRAVYWLTAADSKRLIETRKYDSAVATAVMEPPRSSCCPPCSSCTR